MVYSWDKPAFLLFLLSSYKTGMLGFIKTVQKLEFEILELFKEPNLLSALHFLMLIYILAAAKRQWWLIFYNNKHSHVISGKKFTEREIF